MTKIFDRFALENGGSENMAVDGSGTPQLFDIDISGFRAFDLRTFELYIEDSGVLNDYLGFMAGTSLGVGIQLSTTSQARAFNTDTMKTNRDLIATFGSEAHFSLREIGTKNSFVGTLVVPAGGFVLSPTDTIQAIISDNLTVLDYMTIKVSGVVL